MRLDSDLADVEFAADLLVQQSGNDQHHDLTFTAAEASISSTERPQFRFLMQCRAAALEGSSYRFEQRLVTDRLGQEFDRARLHGLHRRRYVSITGDEDDRHVVAVVLDLLLKIH